MAKKEPLSEGVGFATLKNTYPDASAQLVEFMRGTLRHAQEISTSVGEAEMASERAQTVVKTVDTLTTASERRVVDTEIEKVTKWLNRPREDTTTGWFERYMARTGGNTGGDRDKSTGNTGLADRPPAAERAVSSQAAASADLSPTTRTGGVAASQPGLTNSSTSAATASGDDNVATAAQAMNAAANQSGVQGDSAAPPVSPSTGAGPPTGVAASTSGGDGKFSDVSGDMAEQIETTVMWVQQLLESVHFAESEQGLEPGASLLSIVQPGRRIQKDIALNQSVTLFHEKKIEEEDAEDDAPVFRTQALQAVQSLRESLALPPKVL